jgi:hypothetical protein
MNTMLVLITFTLSITNKFNIAYYLSGCFYARPLPSRWQPLFSSLSHDAAAGTRIEYIDNVLAIMTLLVIFDVNVLSTNMH